MKPIKRILAATDFSPLGNAAVERAILLSARENAALQLVHAFPKPAALASLRALGSGLPGQLRAVAQENLDSLVARAPAASTIEADVLEGSASDVISRAAGDFRPDLVVVGAHGRGALEQFFLGGTASRILAGSSGPVLVVRRPVRADYAQVLAAVDLEPDSARVIDGAVAMSRDGAVTVAHACQSPFDSRLHYRADTAEQRERLAEEEARKAASRIAELIAAHGGGGRLQARVVRGHPNPVLFDLAAEIHADLIVALRHKGSRLEETIMGSIARLLAYNAPCDVLLT